MRAGRGLALDPSDSVWVVVGMTTTPTRIDFIEPAVRSVLNQSQSATLVINVPTVYNSRRSHWNGRSVTRAPRVANELRTTVCLTLCDNVVRARARTTYKLRNCSKVTPPAWLVAMDAEARSAVPFKERCVLINSVPHDWGPATKLVGTVGALRAEPLAAHRDAQRVRQREVIVVAADDDHEWEAYALATLVTQGYGASKGGASLVGHKRSSAVWSYHTYQYPHASRGGPLGTAAKLCIAQAGDMLAAPAPLLEAYLEAWGRELLPGGALPSCFFVDDMFFGAFLKVAAKADVYLHPFKHWLYRESRFL